MSNVVWKQGKYFRIIQEENKYYPQIKQWLFWSKLYYRVDKNINWFGIYKFNTIDEALDFLRHCEGTIGLLGPNPLKEKVI